MALATTTLSSAVAAGDSTINVASATSVAAGRLVIVDGEVMVVSKAYSSGTAVPVLRGRQGTRSIAHASGANVTHGDASDFAAPAEGQSVNYPAPGRTRTVRSYSAAGAIELPSPGEDRVAVINGTGALAMTLANPTKDMDGSFLIIVANGKAAHTVTYTAGLGNGGASFDVGTFSASLQGGCVLCAVNGFWVLIGNGIATATGATGAPLFA